jgi:hypothetical protein
MDIATQQCHRSRGLGVEARGLVSGLSAWLLAVLVVVCQGGEHRCLLTCPSDGERRPLAKVRVRRREPAPGACGPHVTKQMASNGRREPMGAHGGLGRQRMELLVRPWAQKKSANTLSAHCDSSHYTR